jgi:hypothetical protein
LRQKFLLSLGLAFALMAGLPQVAAAQIDPVAMAVLAVFACSVR